MIQRHHFKSCHFQHYIIFLILFFLVLLCFRDVDGFIEYLEKTIQFFTGLENIPEEGGDDGFVPI